MLGSLVIKRAVGSLLKSVKPTQCVNPATSFAPISTFSAHIRQFSTYESVVADEKEDGSAENGKDDKKNYHLDILPTNEHVDEFGRVYSTGRRKTSVARVWIREGSGQFLINGKRISEYFQVHPREAALAPLLATRTAGFLDVWCTVKGGGTSGQAGAVSLGISKALSLWDRSMRADLKLENLLFRDPRNVERKKPGQKKARKKYQWVKR